MLVDPPGIEPGFPACRAGVVPLDHEPVLFSGPDGSRTHHTDLARVSRPQRHAGPFVERSVRELNPASGTDRHGCRVVAYHGRVRPKHLQTNRYQVIADGVEPSLSWMSARRLCRWTTRSSDQGGSRTHKHEALDLAALPVCVPSHGGFGGRTRQARLMRPH